MSQYATKTDLTTYALPIKAVSCLSSAEVEDILVAASGVVDSYIGKRFTLPVSAWGADIRKATAELAAYMVMKRRGWSPGVADAEQLRIAYEDAISWLRDISKGVATPIGVTQSAAVDVTEAGGQGETFVEGASGGGIGLSGVDDGFWEVSSLLSSHRSRGW